MIGWFVELVSEDVVFDLVENGVILFLGYFDDGIWLYVVYCVDLGFVEYCGELCESDIDSDGGIGGELESYVLL